MTFLEGLLSFLSPCVLPLLPVYVIYFAGDDERGGWRCVIKAAAFSLGFSLVFILLGVFAGTLGAALSAHRLVVDCVCGVMIVLFGLSFLGVVRLPFKGVKAMKPVRGTGAAFVLGMVFSVGLTPCVGAFLGAALMTAASEGGAAKGALLLAEYSAGLAIPFVISAWLIDRLKEFFGFFKRNAGKVSVISGALLILLGLWTAGKNFLPASESERGSAQEEKVATEEPLEMVVTDANYEELVLKSKVPVVLDFWAYWCGPCRRLAPELESVAKEYRGRIRVGKVNVDENPALCARFMISGIPALFKIKDGAIVARTVGYQTAEELKGRLCLP